MGDFLEEVSEKYPNIPKDCFTANINFNLKHFVDNEIVPRGDLYLESADGVRSKWIKVSNVHRFVNACRAFGATTGGLVLPANLRVVIMPYMPLEEAFRLHQLCDEPDVLSDSFDHALQILEANVEDHQPVVVDNGVFQEEGEEDMQVDEEKIGHLVVDGLNIGFTVVNYSVLWSKADTYCMLSFLADPIQMFLGHIGNCDQVMANRATPDVMEFLEANLEEAKRQLIFALYHDRTPDAHDALLKLYPLIHNEVYVDCHHCIHLSDHVHEDSDATMERLNQALGLLGYANFNSELLSVEQAKYNLMIAEGRVERTHHIVEASLAFTSARQAFRDALEPVMNQLGAARQTITLMGAVSVEDVGENVGEDNEEE